jgi:transposase
MNPAPQHWKAARRLQAWQLKQRGWSQRRIAEALGVSEGAVSQWMARARQGGPKALRHRPSPGAPRRLTADQLAPLPALLERGPEAYGFRGQLWTRGRIAAVIQLACGVAYHPRQVGRRCEAIRWSPQKPARRARQRDEAASVHWRQETWPALNRGRNPKRNPSSSSMNQDSTRCPVWCVPMRRSARRRSCGSGGPVIISRPSAPYPWTASCISTVRIMLSVQRMGSPS